jgi:hypothetical protein
MPPLSPWMLELFTAEIVPILRRCSLFRTTCAGETLTANYQLARPDMRFGQLPPAPTFTRI